MSPTPQPVRRLEFQVLLTFDPRVQVWAARGVNYDLAAQGKTIADAKVAFERVVIAQLIVDAQDGVDPFSQCPPAPESVRTQFEHAEQMKAAPHLVIPEDLPLPAAYQIDAQLRDMRISA
jgi:hypothetical protein